MTRLSDANPTAGLGVSEAAELTRGDVERVRGDSGRVRVVGAEETNYRDVSSDTMKLLTGLVGRLMRDVAFTCDEVDGLMGGLLTSAETPTGTTRLGNWLEDNANGLGRGYVSELRRNYRGYWPSGRGEQRLAARVWAALPPPIRPCHYRGVGSLGRGSQSPQPAGSPKSVAAQ